VALGREASRVCLAGLAEVLSAAWAALATLGVMLWLARVGVGLSCFALGLDCILCKLFAGDARPVSPYSASAFVLAIDLAPTGLALASCVCRPLLAKQRSPCSE
jgi:hypothetical protein